MSRQPESATPAKHPRDPEPARGSTDHCAIAQQTAIAASDQQAGKRGSNRRRDGPGHQGTPTQAAQFMAPDQLRRCSRKPANEGGWCKKIEQMPKRVEWTHGDQAMKYNGELAWRCNKARQSPGRRTFFAAANL